MDYSVLINWAPCVTFTLSSSSPLSRSTTRRLAESYGGRRWEGEETLGYVLGRRWKARGCAERLGAAWCCDAAWRRPFVSKGGRHRCSVWAQVARRHVTLAWRFDGRSGRLWRGEAVGWLVEASVGGRGRLWRGGLWQLGCSVGIQVS